MEYLRTEFIPVEHNYRDDCNQRRIQGGAMGLSPPGPVKSFDFMGFSGPNGF